MTPSGGDRQSPAGRFRQSLRLRVYALMTVAVLAPAALAGSFAWSRLRELDDEWMSAREDAAAAVAERVDEELSADLLSLQRIASSPQMGFDTEHVESARSLLRATHLHSAFLGGMFLLDARGRPVVEEPGSGRSVAPPADLAEVQAVLRDGKPRVTGLVLSRDEARVYALVAVADWHGRLVGAVGGVVDAAGGSRSRVLGDLVRRAGHADLIDAGGRILASSDRARVRTAGPCARRLVELVAEKRREVGRCRDCHRGGAAQVTAFAPLAVAPWGVVTAEPEALLPTARAIPQSHAVFALALLPLAALYAWGAQRSVTRPVAVLTGAVERIAAGGLDERVPELGDDELGRLGRSVERMRTSLRDLIAFVGRTNEDLEQRVQARTRELAAANDQLRERDEQRGRLLRIVITAQEDERKRLARELHDETTQSLAVLAMRVESADSALRSGGPQPRLDEIKALAVKTLEEVHRLILDLRPAVLDDLGLFSALRWYAERQLASRGIAVRCEIQALERRLPPEVEIALFRIGQETMNNIARHAQAESVLIQLALDARELRTEFEDDGRGFDPSSSPQDRPHYGLMGIRERAELLGGCAVIDSAPGKGTRVRVTVPLEPQGSPHPEESPG
jgi:signal transduction histidine kinase